MSTASTPSTTEILLVETDPLIFQLLRNLFFIGKLTQYIDDGTLFTARSWDEVPNMLGRNYDLIFVGWHKGDALVTLETLRNKYPQAKIIVRTGGHSEDVSKEFPKADFILDGCLTPERLLEALRQVDII